MTLTAYSNLQGKHSVVFITNKLHLVSVDNPQSIMEPEGLNLLLLLLFANRFLPGGNVLQCKTGKYDTKQYNTTQFNTIKHITQNHTQHLRQPSIPKITKKKTRTNIIPYQDSEKS